LTVIWIGRWGIADAWQKQHVGDRRDQTLALFAPIPEWVRTPKRDGAPRKRQGNLQC